MKPVSMPLPWTAARWTSLAYGMYPSMIPPPFICCPQRAPPPCGCPTSGGCLGRSSSPISRTSLGELEYMWRSRERSERSLTDPPLPPNQTCQQGRTVTRAARCLGGRLGHQPSDRRVRPLPPGRGPDSPAAVVRLQGCRAPDGRPAGRALSPRLVWTPTLQAHTHTYTLARDTHARIIDLRPRLLFGGAYLADITALSF